MAKIPSNVLLFRSKIKQLKTFIFGEEKNIFHSEYDTSFIFTDYQKTIEDDIHLPEEIRYNVFISISNKTTKAHVFHVPSATLADAWNNSVSISERFITDNKIQPVWVKIDILCNAQSSSLSNTVSEAVSGYNEYYRHGISFDPEMKTAILEAEINGNRIITYKKNIIELKRVNNYTQSAFNITFPVLPEEVIVFDCNSYFCDEEKNTFKLYPFGLNCGRRIIDKVDKNIARQVILTSSDYLRRQLGCEGVKGKFRYGVYPIFHREIRGYNILRHAGSLWSLMLAYQVTGTKALLSQVNQAIEYLLQFEVGNDANITFIVDETKNEIKLGGAAITIIMLTEYMTITESLEYLEVCKRLGNGILKMQEEDGSFVHVLNPSDYSVKEKMRTVYYDGEACFALSRLYSFTKDSLWLDHTRKSIDYFIENDYTKYRDHWITYALNEFTMHIPEEKYFEFAFRNAGDNLKKIYNRERTRL